MSPDEIDDLAEAIIETIGENVQLYNEKGQRANCQVLAALRPHVLAALAEHLAAQENFPP